MTNEPLPSGIGLAQLTQALRRAGALGDYDRDALDDDYRLSVLWRSTTPIWQATSNIPPVIWWNNLERVLLAVDDLGCGDLLA
jgi:hypothetical protein